MPRWPRSDTPDAAAMLADVIAMLEKEGAMRASALAIRLRRSRPSVERAVELGLRARRLVKYQPNPMRSPVFGLIGVPYVAPVRGPSGGYADAPPLAAWVHPIAAGTAAKVKYAPTLPLDYSDPRRRAA